MSESNLIDVMVERDEASGALVVMPNGPVEQAARVSLILAAPAFKALIRRGGWNVQIDSVSGVLVITPC